MPRRAPRRAPPLPTLRKRPSPKYLQRSSRRTAIIQPPSVHAPASHCGAAHHPTTDYSISFVEDRRLPGRYAHGGLREERSDLAGARVLDLARDRRAVVADLYRLGLRRVEEPVETPYKNLVHLQILTTPHHDLLCPRTYLGHVQRRGRRHPHCTPLPDGEVHH